MRLINMPSRTSLINYTVVIIAITIIYFTVSLGIAILSICMVMILFLEVIRVVPWIPVLAMNKSGGIMHKPFVTVHLAIHNECPSMVVDTIKSILNQDYHRFEIIVIDNNTRDNSKWGAVESYCENLEGVRFYHLEHWPFYKAGALNFARLISSSKAEYIFVVDADYNLNHNALSTAVENLVSDSALVQFPQSYILENKCHASILEDFDHYFKYYSLSANNCFGSLATGTLSLVKITALDQVGGWPTDSITEDAELGMRLQSKGFKITYVNSIIGKGIAPIAQEDFNKQRKRWIFGNIQTLTAFSISPLTDFSKCISGIAQLTAWCNLLGIPILFSIASIISFIIFGVDSAEVLLNLAITSIWIVLISKLLQLLLMNQKNYKLALGAFSIYISSLSIGAFYWWPALFGGKRPFLTTDKSKKQHDFYYNVNYQLLYLGLFWISLKFDNKYLTASAILLSIVYLISALFECYSRTGALTNIKIKLKL